MRCNLPAADGATAVYARTNVESDSFSAPGRCCRNPVELHEPIFMAVSEAEHAHACDMVTHRRSQVAAITWQRPQCLQRFCGTGAKQRPGDRSSQPASKSSTQLRERVDRNSFSGDKPVEKAIDPLSVHQRCLHTSLRASCTHILCGFTHNVRMAGCKKSDLA